MSNLNLRHLVFVLVALGMGTELHAEPREVSCANCWQTEQGAGLLCSGGNEADFKNADAYSVSRAREARRLREALNAQGAVYAADSKAGMRETSTNMAGNFQARSQLARNSAAQCRAAIDQARKTCEDSCRRRDPKVFEDMAGKLDQESEQFRTVGRNWNERAEFVGEETYPGRAPTATKTPVIYDSRDPGRFNPPPRSADQPVSNVFVPALDRTPKQRQPAPEPLPNET